MTGWDSPSLIKPDHKNQIITRIQKNTDTSDGSVCPLRTNYVLTPNPFFLFATRPNLVGIRAEEIVHRCIAVVGIHFHQSRGETDITSFPADWLSRNPLSRVDPDHMRYRQGQQVSTPYSCMENPDEQQRPLPNNAGIWNGGPDHLQMEILIWTRPESWG